MQGSVLGSWLLKILTSDFIGILFLNCIRIRFHLLDIKGIKILAFIVILFELELRDPVSSLVLI